MDMLTSLVDTSELKSNRLSELLKRGAPTTTSIAYNPTTDTFRILFVSPETDTFVHYIDGDVAVIVDSEDLEIIGFHIEDFEHRFMPAHAGIQGVWRLSSSGVQLNKVTDFGDFAIQFEIAKEKVTREIYNASRQTITDKHIPLLIPSYA